MQRTKKEPQKKLNMPVRETGAGGIQKDAFVLTGINTGVIDAPTGLTLSSTRIIRSNSSPKSYIDATWNPPIGVTVEYYEIEYGLETDWSGSAFSNAIIRRSYTNEATLLVDANTEYRVRVRAIVGSALSRWSTSETITSASDTSTPGDLTTVDATFSNGDLILTWAYTTTPSNFFNVKIEIWDSGKTTLLDTIYDNTGKYIWTAERNIDAGTHTSVSVDFTPVSYGGNEGNTSNDTTTSSAPTTPSGLTTSWDSDSGNAAADLQISWTYVQNHYYKLTIDNVHRYVHADKYLYTLTQNEIENGSPDPTLGIGLRAVNKLGQESNQATISPVNAAPPATTLTATGAFSQIRLQITESTANDLRNYRIRVYKDTSLEETFFTQNIDFVYQATEGTGSYEFDVTVYDLFGQISSASTKTTAIDVTDLTQFVNNLRAGLIYTDELNTSSTTLEGLKDNDVSTNVVQYSGDGVWRWTQADWQTEERIKTLTYASEQWNTIILAYSNDGTTWTYAHGGTPDTTNNIYEATLTTSSLVTAQADAEVLGANGSWRLEFPTTITARYIRVYHRHSSNDYYLKEFFPRRLVQADDIESEAITTIHIAANAITADQIAADSITSSKIDVTDLSAISADLGTITAGSISSATITGGSISGTSISGGSITGGIFTVSSGGKIRTTIDEIGGIQLDTNGFRLQPSVQDYGAKTTYVNDCIVFTRGWSSPFVANIFAYEDTSNNIADLYLVAMADTSLLQHMDDGIVHIVAETGSGSTNPVEITVDGKNNRVDINRDTYIDGNLVVDKSSSNTTLVINSDTSNYGILAFSGNNYNAFAFGLQNNSSKDFFLNRYNVSTGAYIDNMWKILNSNGCMAFGGSTPYANQRIRIKSTGDTNTHYDLLTHSASGTANFYVRGDGSGYLRSGVWSSSDASVKNNIQDDSAGLVELLQLRSKIFDYIDGPQKRRGLVAQELQTILPDIVDVVDEEGRLGINYQELIPVIIKSIQELVRILKNRGVLPNR